MTSASAAILAGSWTPGTLKMTCIRAGIREVPEAINQLRRGSRRVARRPKRG